MVERKEAFDFRRASALQKSGEEAGHRGQEGPGERGQLISTEFVKQSSLFYF